MIITELTGFPMAAISILGATEQRFKARIGIPFASTPIEQAFCRFTVQSDNVMVVPDACADDRFAQNPLVTESPHIRSYAGAPLLMGDGSRIGTLCILDTVPRELGKREQELLHLTARSVVAQLELEQLIDQQSKAIVDLQGHQHELHHRAIHDELTQVLNRRGIIEELDRRLLVDAHPSVEPHDRSWLFFIDLDNFKVINDTLGHTYGDRVLAAVAGRLTAQGRSDDLVGRIGGDEFVVVTRAADADQARRHAHELLASLEEPIALGATVIRCRASVGMSTNAGGTSTAVDMISEADRAMYAVKQTGGARSAGRTEQAEAAGQLDLRSRSAFVSSALQQRRIVAHYQPICDLVSRRAVRHEALIRWTGLGPDGLTPAGFIDAAECAGLIGDVGSEVLRQACTFASITAEDETPRRVAVNLSPIQVEPGLDQTIAQALEASGLAPEQLTIEITEARALQPDNSAKRILEALSALGVKLSLDDFGTGYASVAMLCDLPFDELKIDGRFCSTDDPKMLQIVSAAVRIGESFGLEVVAEGLETEEMAQRVLDLGCDLGQGYHLGRPQPAEQVLDVVHATATTG